MDSTSLLIASFHKGASGLDIASLKVKGSFSNKNVRKSGPKDFEVPLWKEAINSEVESILQNRTWELVDLPPSCKPLGYKWIFKRKMKANGSIDKYKARLVVKGFRQKEGLDYFDTYSPVTRITSIRMLIVIASL